MPRSLCTVASGMLIDELQFHVSLQPSLIFLLGAVLHSIAAEFRQNKHRVEGSACTVMTWCPQWHVSSGAHVASVVLFTLRRSLDVSVTITERLGQSLLVSPAYNTLLAGT